jgi:hypothetical protein
MLDYLHAADRVKALIWERQARGIDPNEFSIQAAIVLLGVGKLRSCDIDPNRRNIVGEQIDQCPGAATEVEMPRDITDLLHDAAEFVMMPFALDPLISLKNLVIETDRDGVVGIRHTKKVTIRVNSRPVHHSFFQL